MMPWPIEAAADQEQGEAQGTYAAGSQATDEDRPLKRRRTALTSDQPLYPGVSAAQQAAHHARAKKYALRVALGLPIDVPHAQWGQLRELQQQAAAVGIRSIPTEVLLAYQPRKHPVHPPAQEPSTHPGQQSSPALPMVWSNQNATTLGNNHSASSGTGILSANMLSQTENVWVALNSMPQLAAHYTSARAQQGRETSWPSWQKCREAVHTAVRASLGLPITTDSRKWLALEKTMKKLRNRGITHLPLKVLLLFSLPNRKRASKAHKQLLRNAHCDHWWPPESLQGSIPSTAAEVSATVTADDSIVNEATPNGNDQKLDGNQTKSVTAGHPERVQPAVHHNKISEAEWQEAGRTNTRMMEQAGLKVMTAPAACAFIQHLISGTRPSWVDSDAVQLPYHTQVQGGISMPDWKQRERLISLSPVQQHTVHGLPGYTVYTFTLPNNLPQACLVNMTRVQNDAWAAALPASLLIRDMTVPSAEASAILKFLVPNPKHAGTFPLHAGSPAAFQVVARSNNDQQAAQAVMAVVHALVAHAKALPGSPHLQSPGKCLNRQLALVRAGLVFQIARGQELGQMSRKQLQHDQGQEQKSKHVTDSQDVPTGPVIHLQLSPLGLPAFPKLGCGSCAVCTDPARFDQPCLRASLFLHHEQPEVGSDSMQNGRSPRNKHTQVVDHDRQGHQRLLGNTSQGQTAEVDENVHRVGLLTSRSGTPKHMRFAIKDRQEQLQQQHKQYLTGSLQLTGLAAHASPSDCLKIQNSWKAVPTGAASCVTAAVREEQVATADSVINSWAVELDNLQRGLEVYDIARQPIVGLEDASPTLCELCASSSHSRALCPLWSLQVLPAEESQPVSSLSLPGQRHRGEQILQPPGQLGSTTNQKRRVKAGNMPAGKRQKMDSTTTTSRDAGTINAAVADPHQEDVVQDLNPGLAIVGSSLGKHRAVKQGWSSPDSVVVKKSLRSKPEELQYRYQHWAKGSDQPLNVQVRTHSNRPFKDVSLHQTMQLPCLTMEQHATLQHRLQQAPAWAHLIPPDLLEAVMSMRETMAWLGFGSAASQHGRVSIEDLKENTTDASHEHAGATASGSRIARDQQSDKWQSLDICLALTLLAEEQAAELAGLT